MRSLHLYPQMKIHSETEEKLKTYVSMIGHTEDVLYEAVDSTLSFGGVVIVRTLWYILGFFSTHLTKQIFFKKRPTPNIEWVKLMSMSPLLNQSSSKIVKYLKHIHEIKPATSSIDHCRAHDVKYIPVLSGWIKALNMLQKRLNNVLFVCCSLLVHAPPIYS